MSNEFQRLNRNSAVSTKGFKVTLHLSGGVDYSDVNGDVHVDSEILIKPLPGTLLYQRSGDLIGMPALRADEILRNIVRALEYLGHRVEISVV